MHRFGWIQLVPDLRPPYKTSGKIAHRAWFSPEEYKQLYEATRKRGPKAPQQSVEMGVGAVARLRSLYGQYWSSTR